MVTSLFPEKFRTIDKSRSRFLIKILTAGAIVCAVVCAGVAYSRSRKAIERAQTVAQLQGVVSNVLEYYRDVKTYDGLNVDFLVKNRIVPSKKCERRGDMLHCKAGYFMTVRPSDYPRKIKSFLLEYNNLRLDLCVALLTADWDKSNSQKLRTLIVGGKIYTWSYMQKSLKIQNSLPVTKQDARENCAVIVGDHAGYIVFEYF